MRVAEEAGCQLEAGLTAAEVDRRLLALSREHNRIEAALCFYLKEMQRRELYVSFGFSSTADYARERLGFEDRKTRSFLYMADRFETLPEIGQAFAQGELAWTKVREVVKVAQPETESLWLEKCKNLSNRQRRKLLRGGGARRSTSGRFRVDGGEGAPLREVRMRNTKRVTAADLLVDWCDGRAVLAEAGSPVPGEVRRLVTISSEREGPERFRVLEGNHRKLDPARLLAPGRNGSGGAGEDAEEPEGSRKRSIGGESPSEQRSPQEALAQGHPLVAP
jgi:hypothetical protein